MGGWLVGIEVGRCEILGIGPLHSAPRPPSFGQVFNNSLSDLLITVLIERLAAAGRI
jgi:hypothetical protein